MKGLRELVWLVAVTAVGSASVQYNCIENAKTLVRSVEQNNIEQKIFMTDFPVNLPEEFFPCFEDNVRIESKGRMEAEYLDTRDGKRYYHIKIKEGIKL